MKRKITTHWPALGSLLLGAVVGTAGFNVAEAQDRAAARASQAAPASVEALRLEAPLGAQVVPNFRSKLSPELVGAKGASQVIIRLALPAAGEMGADSPAASLSQKLNIEFEQSDFLRRGTEIAPGMKVIARTQIVLNAVFVEVDAALLPELAKDPAVKRIAPVANYELDLADTVPYIGGTAVQGQGFDGTSIRVAVLDSGIDYTHANMGGPGTLEAYEAAWGVDLDDPRNTTRDGLFPTDKVVDGYDFVGEFWPFDDLAPDEDPIDLEGHGSHVADIIGGTNGVAPDVDLYAVKVCSAVSSSCSGVALIQGMEFAVDPNGDGNTKDRVDVINMSLGSIYGQPFDDDLVAAVENASKVGVLTVASAGNSGDSPYITGTPAAAPSALSVAQTQVPSASLQLIDVDGVQYPAVFQQWSAPLSGAISAPVVYGADFGSALGCSVGPDVNGTDPGTEPYPPGTFSGQIVLVDRGACNFSIKIFNIQRGGGSAGIIGLVAPGAPFAGAFGAGGPYTIPGYMINQADSNSIKAQIGGPGLGTIDENNQLSLIGQMVGSSSRGPSNQFQQIKPEIGAPGASLSLEAGTGTGETPFGGTSGAAPMVAGSAALLLDATCDTDDDSDSDSDSDKGKKNKGHKCPPPAVTKARLMNTGEQNIDIDPFSGLAEITRIGGGEVRVDRALAAKAAAWDKESLQGGLSFGFVDVADATVTLEKKVRVAGVSSGDDDDSDSDGKTSYDIVPTFRYDDDAASGAITPSTSKSRVTIKGPSKKNFKVSLTIDGASLPGNFMNSGSEGANGAVLSINEYDGYLNLDAKKGQDIHLPWHVLPRKAARVEAPGVFASGGFPTTVGLNNTGVGTAQNDGYALVATSPDQPSGAPGEQEPTPDLRAVGVNTFPVGFCPGGFIWAFAINTWERQSHLLPVIFIVALDTDQDGVDDYWVLNSDLAGPFDFGDGRQVTWAVDLATGDASAFFFTEHATNTANTVLLICGAQVGLGEADLLATNVDVSVEAFDFYFGGPGDFIDGITVTPLGEQYFPLTSDIPGNSAGALDVYDFGPFPGNTPEQGVLLITNGDRGAGARGGATQETEALIIEAQ